MGKRQFKTLLQCMDEVVNKWGLSARVDRIANFDGRRYSFLNLRNFLVQWHGADAYFTDVGNIKFNTLDGKNNFALIVFEKKEEE